MDFEIDDDTLNEVMNLHEKAESNLKKSNGVCQATEEKKPSPANLKTLSKYFGHKTFRPLQWEIIHAIIEDRRDVCAVMSTGYGKSLCYQYPSVFMGGVTVVISPLISLMEDQILSLNVSNIPACLLGTAQKEKVKVTEEILAMKYPLVYITPEFCTSDQGLDLLRKISHNISLIAVDEAHCVSSWGHDFRFQYRELGLLHDVLPEVPIMAVTATATSRVRQDIVKTLKLRNPLMVNSGFDRPNLYLSVHLKGDSGILSDLRKVMICRNSLWSFSGPTIIYCLTRKQTDQLTELLTMSGIKCLPYHAGLSLTVRKDTHEQFVKDKIDVIVATIAFGMGIDKPDVRNIIHHGAPRSIEGYYQEVGRASRDGEPANCVCFYDNSDFGLHRKLAEIGYGGKAAKEMRNEGLEVIQKYLSSRECRRRFILEYFGGDFDLPEGPRKNCCDNCTEKRFNGNLTDQDRYEGIDEKGLYDFTADARSFLKAVQAMQGKFGISTYVLFLKGSASAKLKPYHKNHYLYGSGKDKSQDWWKAIGSLLLREKYLKEVFTKMSSGFSFTTNDLSDKGIKILSQNNPKLLLAPSPDILKLLKRKRTGWSTADSTLSIPTSSSSASSSTNSTCVSVKKDGGKTQMTLYRKLLERRTDLASKHDCMPYMVASNAALMELANAKPGNIMELRACQLNCFTEAKLAKFGEDFLEVVRNFGAAAPCSQKQSIRQILSEHPVPDCRKMNVSAEISYNFLKSGLSIEKISEERGFAVSTIVGHLCSCMMVGFPVKIADAGVTNQQRDIIIEQLLKTDFEGLTQIKAACPEDITFDQIRVVSSYFKLRTHLRSLGIPYEEFEDFDFNDLRVPQKDNLSMFIDMCNEMLGEGEGDSDATEILSDLEESSPEKKGKMARTNSILDSPPRHGFAKAEPVADAQPATCAAEKQETVEGAEVGRKRAKKTALPPWLC